MLTRISCDACRLSALWTDDPLGFLDTVCVHYSECRARLSAEGMVEESGREKRGEMPAYKR
jgi:hypothetical protein